MLPCPHCEREFETRNGLMGHVGRIHKTEPVPVNEGGAIEPVVPVEREVASEAYYVSPGAPAVDIVNGPISGVAVYESPEPDAWHERTPEPSLEERAEIRTLQRAGRSRHQAYEVVMGHPMPPEPEPVSEDPRPVRLQQVAFRVRNGWSDQIDARWLLTLAEIAVDASEWMDDAINASDVNWGSAQPILDRWKAAIQP